MSKDIGQATNNIAEWSGAVEALLFALGNRSTFGEVELRMDSRLVVEQLNGRWAVRNPGLTALAERGRTVLQRLREHGVRVTVRWVPRAQNTEADALAGGRSASRHSLSTRKMYVRKPRRRVMPSALSVGDGPPVLRKRQG